jgi:hypothetical protein|tara:strand:- start:319 stop:519 length:201 start_codon:yes stop_codon:yes gene_type:complete
MNNPSFSPPASLRPLSSTYGVGSSTYGLNPRKTVIDGLEPHKPNIGKYNPLITKVVPFVFVIVNLF